MQTPEAILMFEPIDARILILVRLARASPSSASADARQIFLALQLECTRDSFQLAGNDCASARTIVQCCRSIGIRRPPRAGLRMCCSIANSKCAP